MSASPPRFVRDVMTPKPVCASPEMTVRRLASLFAEHHISGAPVVGREGKLIGVVSRTDLFRRVTLDSPTATPGYLFDLLNDQVSAAAQPVPEPLIVIGDFMSESVVTATPDEPIGVVARRMADKRVHRVVVVDQDNRPVGMVTTLDLLRVFPA